MMFPAVLHLPSVFGTVLGIIIGAKLWEANPALAVFVGFVCLAVGWWFGMWWADKFFKSLSKW